MSASPLRLGTAFTLHHMMITAPTCLLQFSAKHEQDLDCGGGYIKLLPASR